MYCIGDFTTIILIIFFSLQTSRLNDTLFINFCIQTPSQNYICHNTRGPRVPQTELVQRWKIIFFRKLAKMSLIVSLYLNKIRKFAGYKSLAVSKLGCYPVTSRPAISDIYDKIGEYLKVCNRRESNTKMMRAPGFMMISSVTAYLYEITFGIEIQDTSSIVV